MLYPIVSKHRLISHGFYGKTAQCLPSLSKEGTVNLVNLIRTWEGSMENKWLFLDNYGCRPIDAGKSARYPILHLVLGKQGRWIDLRSSLLFCHFFLNELLEKKLPVNFRQQRESDWSWFGPENACCKQRQEPFNSTAIRQGRNEKSGYDSVKKKWINQTSALMHAISRWWKRRISSKEVPSKSIDDFQVKKKTHLYLETPPLCTQEPIHLPHYAHYREGDVSESFLRSTFSRKTYFRAAHQLHSFDRHFHQEWA